MRMPDGWALLQHAVRPVGHGRIAGFLLVFAQVKVFLRTVSVAVRVLGRERSREHGHIADSGRAAAAVRRTARCRGR